MDIRAEFKDLKGLFSPQESDKKPIDFGAIWAKHKIPNNANDTQTVQNDNMCVIIIMGEEQ